MRLIEGFINEIIQVKTSLDLNDEEILIEVDEFNKIINGLSYKIINPRGVGLAKKMATMLFNTGYLDYDDVTQELLLCIILSFQEFDKRNEYSIEKCIELFLMNDEASPEDIIRVSKFYKLLETKVNQYLSIILNHRKRKASAEIYGKEVKVISFGELISGDSEETMEEFIDRVNINANRHNHIENLVNSTLLNWLEEKKVSLTKGELEYLKDPLKFTPASRTSYQKKIGKKLSEEARKEFGTTEEKVVKDIIIYKIIDKVLASEDFQKELINNIDTLEKYIYGNIESFEVLKDITSAINKENHICKNSSLLAVSKILWEEFNKLEYKINNEYKISSEEKIDKLVKKRFNINLIDGIDTSDNETYKKRVNGKNVQSWERFRKMHKRAFENNQKLEGDFLSYTKFCKWLKDNQVTDEVSKIYHSNEKELSSENSYILPTSVMNFLSPVNIRYDKADKIYKGVFTWNGKCYSFYSTDNPEELEKRVKEAKTLKLREIAESKKDIIPSRAYEFLSGFKF